MPNCHQVQYDDPMCHWCHGEGQYDVQVKGMDIFLPRLLCAECVRFHQSIDPECLTSVANCPAMAQLVEI